MAQGSIEMPAMNKASEGLVDFRVAKQLLVLYLLSKYPKGLKGTTRLQKLVYLLEKDTQHLNVSPFTFRYWHYGPYSSDLADFVTFLASKNLIEVRQHSIGNTAVGYTYYLTEEGRDFVEIAAKVLQKKIISTFDQIIDKYGYIYRAKLLKIAYEDLRDECKGDTLIKQRIGPLFYRESLLNEKEESDLEDLYLLNSAQFSRTLNKALEETRNGKTREWQEFFATL